MLKGDRVDPADLEIDILVKMLPVHTQTRTRHDKVNVGAYFLWRVFLDLVGGLSVDDGSSRRDEIRNKHSLR